MWPEPRGPLLARDTHRCPGCGPQAGSSASPPAAGAPCTAVGGHGTPRGWYSGAGGQQRQLNVGAPPWPPAVRLYVPCAAPLPPQCPNHVNNSTHTRAPLLSGIAECFIHMGHMQNPSVQVSRLKLRRGQEEAKPGWNPSLSSPVPSLPAMSCSALPAHLRPFRHQRPVTHPLPGALPNPLALPSPSPAIALPPTPASPVPSPPPSTP